VTRTVDILINSVRARWATIPLGRRYAAINLSASVLGFLLFGAFVAIMQYRSSLESIIDASRVQAAIIADNVNAAVSFGDGKAAQEILATLRSQKTIEVAKLRSPDGDYLAVYRREKSGLELPSQTLQDDEYVLRGDYMHLQRAVEFNNKKVATLELWVDLSPIYARIWGVVLVTLLTALVLALGTGFAAMYFQTHLSRPLLDVARTMKFIKSNHDYSVRAPVSSKDEVATFVSGFNEMLEQIEDQQRLLQIELSERADAERRLDYLAHHDVVTGLPNRNFFASSLEHMLTSAITSGRGLVVVFLDLDNFKYVNDSLGHHAGDLLLRAVADRLNASVRKGDVLCRIGGDEFAIVAERLDDQAQIIMFAEKLITLIKQPFELFGEKIYVGASAGIARAPFDGNDSQTLLRNADAAMYHAKEQGKNSFQFYSSAMNERFSGRFKMESALRDALARNEFFLLYQPEIDLVSGRMTGCEALIRWRDSQGVLHLPDEFLPIAEEAGLDVPISEWVVDTACAQLAVWQEAGIGLDVGHGALRMAINVSGRELSRQSLPAVISTAIQKYRIEPGQLEIEITESTLIQDPEHCVVMLDALKRMGINIAIDDFGVGYSSLGYLRRFPIDKLKIDKSFIRDVPHNADSSTICDAIIALASALKLTVLAEGVELPAQLEYLRKRGCHMAQGYYWSKPIPAKKLAEYLTSMRLPTIAAQATVLQLNPPRAAR
jgi:diguanylate cyclase (GGDEF)-like protein